MTEFGISSDMGRVREANEDRYGSEPRINLFVLSDGMGGLECGEVASRIAVDTVIEHCREASENPALPLMGKPIQGVSETANRLASAIRLANQAVRAAALERAMSNGMGATIMAIQLVAERMTLAHVGDSRAYRLRGDEFEQLTRDHSYVADQVRQGKMSEEQAAESALKNVLIRALGVEPEVDVDVSDELVMEDDTILMCSDGLTNELSDAQIAAVLGETEDPQEATDRLIGLANEAGGGDNITAIVLRPAPRPVGAIGRFIRCFRG